MKRYIIAILMLIAVLLYSVVEELTIAEIKTETEFYFKRFNNAVMLQKYDDARYTQEKIILYFTEQKNILYLFTGKKQSDKIINYLIELSYLSDVKNIYEIILLENTIIELLE